VIAYRGLLLAIPALLGLPALAVFAPPPWRRGARHRRLRWSILVLSDRGRKLVASDAAYQSVAWSRGRVGRGSPTREQVERFCRAAAWFGAEDAQEQAAVGGELHVLEASSTGSEADRKGMSS
jgi:hypothetical protein